MRTVFLILYLVISINGHSQVITREELSKFRNYEHIHAIEEFYKTHGGYAWINKPDLQTKLLLVLKNAESVGLNKSDYQEDFFLRFDPIKPLNSRIDSVEADIRFTDAALHFFIDIKNGNNIPFFRFNGLQYAPDEVEVVRQLQHQLVIGKLQDLANKLQPVFPEYHAMIALLNQYQRTMNEQGFREVKIRSKKMDSSNLPLFQRLFQLGFTRKVEINMAKAELEKIARQVQQMFNLKVDGIVGPATIGALNLPIKRRINELKLSINHLRWMNQLRSQSSVLLLNIPAAYLKVYDKGSKILELKVIAGKPSTPTPTLTSTIKETVLYPYWMVPHNIATRELLPSIRKNVGFLASGNYQVLNKKGKILDPYSIDWNSLSPAYFPYIIRQSTGCENSLGIVKFEFENPFTVYLHDTPTKKLFNSNRRFFSHGCMRVENPEKLAHYLLGRNSIAIDTLTEMGCLNHKAPKKLAVERPLPILIFYSTCWYDSSGRVIFYEDVYRRIKE